MKLSNRHILPLLFAVVLVGITACSTQKNTARNRWWHAFHARYNTYYNGTLAYIDGSLEKEQGNKDNYTEMIPLYTVGNKNSKELGKANFDRAIEKSKKAIQRHSMKRRPEWTKSRKKTAADIEWLNRREYNPFIWKAWMLMGRSQFHQGDFEGAASTFAYMGRLFETQPAIYGRARAWLAKCYVEEGWMYDAEDVIRNIERDSIHWRAQKEWDYTYADYYIHAGRYELAVPYLRKVIKHEMRRKQRAREWYLMGQIQAALGNKAEAYSAFKHVVRLNPPYELEFNARISMSEVMASENSKQVIGRLKRMAASDKNKEYLDQVYYAIGNIYLAQRDTMQAIGAYERGNAKATRNGIEKGVLLLHLGDLYWQKELYGDARRCYGEAIGLLDKDRKDYKQLSERSKILDELVPYTDAVHLQDSLQSLAKMSETDRNAAIDRVIAQLKKKEKEEKDKQAEAEAEKQLAKNSATGNNAANNKTTNTTSTTGGNSTTWYFYNPMAVSQGKTAFQKQWGKRENVDNWQRVNKTVVAAQPDVEEITDEARDSLIRAAEQEDSIKHLTDSAQNDPHKREYYLAQIPFSEDQIQESNKILTDGLYHSGVIFKDKLDNLGLSEKALRRVETQYPDYEHMDDVFYHLYLLYSRKGLPSTADTYIARLKKDYPKSQWTTLLTDPYYAENAKFGVHIEDSLYSAAYEAFKSGIYDMVKANAEMSAQRFPMGANRDKFLFIGGLSKLNAGDATGCVADMKTIVEKYPEGRISEMAGMIVNGVNDGKRLRGGTFDLANVWAHRSVVLNEGDAAQAKAFSDERNTPYVFLLAYQPDSLNENQLLFEMAKFNFTTYLVRSFDLSIEEQDGLHRMVVKGFRTYNEAVVYAHDVLGNSQIMHLLGKYRAIVISEQNLALLGTQFTYDEYAQFYNKHFLPLKSFDRQLLAEPTEVVVSKEEPSQSRDGESDDEDLEDVGNMEKNAEGTVSKNGTIVVQEEETPAEQKSSNTVVTESENTEKQQTERESTVVKQEIETDAAVTSGQTVIPEEKKESPRMQDTVVPGEKKQELPLESTVVPKQEVPSETAIVPEVETSPLQSTTTTVVLEEEETTSSKEGTTLVETDVEEMQKKEEKVEKPEKKTEKKPETTPEKETVKPEKNDIKVEKEEDKAEKEEKSEKKEESYDLEDEYFELDGF